jgi:Uma2 family endonuclease
MENVVEEPALAYNRKSSLEAYLDMNWEDGVRYEFWNGQLVAMAGGTLSRGDIVYNIHTLIKKGTSKKGCKSYQENVFLRIKKENILFFPDVIVSCNPDELTPNNRFLEHPSILVEVLSDSTELYDRTQKWEQYRKIPSLRYYLLVSKKKLQVEMYHRPNAQSLFYFQAFEGEEAIIPFPDFGFEITLAEIYEGVTLEIEDKELEK